MQLQLNHLTHAPEFIRLRHRIYVCRIGACDLKFADDWLSRLDHTSTYLLVKLCGNYSIYEELHTLAIDSKQVLKIQMQRAKR